MLDAASEVLGLARSFRTVFLAVCNVLAFGRGLGGGLPVLLLLSLLPPLRGARRGILVGAASPLLRALLLATSMLLLSALLDLEILGPRNAAAVGCCPAGSRATVRLRNSVTLKLWISPTVVAISPC